MEKNKDESRKTYDSNFFFPLSKDGVCGDSQIHVTLQPWLAASSTCSETTKAPLCFPWAGPIVPIRVDRHGAWHVHHLPRCSWSFRALMRNPWETTTVVRLIQLPHKQLICFTNQQGILQVQGCSTDVKSNQSYPQSLASPLPPRGSCVHLWTSFSGTKYPPWIIK